MYCPHCGSEVAATSRRCDSCGRDIVPLRPPATGSKLGDDPAMRMILPVGRSGLSIAAGYAGLFALLIIFAPIALVLGILAVRDLRKNPAKRGMGRALFGLVMGALGTLFLLWFVVSSVVGLSG